MPPSIRLRRIRYIPAAGASKTGLRRDFSFRPQKEKLYAPRGFQGAQSIAHPTACTLFKVTSQDRKVNTFYQVKGLRSREQAAGAAQSGARIALKISTVSQESEIAVEGFS